MPTVRFRRSEWEPGVSATRDFKRFRDWLLFIAAVVVDPDAKIVWFSRKRAR